MRGLSEYPQQLTWYKAKELNVDAYGALGTLYISMTHHIS